MRRRRPPSLATLALSVTVALALVPAGAGGAAARPAGPVVSRVTAIALPEYGDAGVNTTGLDLAGGRGRPVLFAGCYGTGGSDIWFAERGADGTWATRRTPYRGILVAQAADRTGGYVLFTRPEGSGTVLLLGRRAGGAFRPAVRVGRADGLFEAALAADGGEWWAVWTRVRYGERPILYEARTYGRDLAARRLPVQPDGGGADLLYTPKLALGRGGAALAFVTQHLREYGRPWYGGIWLGRGTGTAWRFAEVVHSDGGDGGPALDDFDLVGGTARLLWDKEAENALTTVTGAQARTVGLDVGYDPQLAERAGVVAIGSTSLGSLSVPSADLRFGSSARPGDLSTPLDIGTGFLDDLAATGDGAVVALLVTSRNELVAVTAARARPGAAS